MPHRSPRRTQRRSPLPRGVRLLGFDLGEKTIGIALSDTLTIATPMETLARGKFSADAVKIEAIIAKQNVGGLIVGLPLNMDGSEGPSAQSARGVRPEFCGALHAALSCWIDERLSTARGDAHADRRRRVAQTRGPRLSTRWRLATILQGALDRLRNMGT